MNDHIVDITLLLDRTGSMAQIKTRTLSSSLSGSGFATTRRR